MIDSNLRPSILIISSVDPSIGPARVSDDYYNAFKQAGFQIDLLTLYPVKGKPEYLSVYNKPSRSRDLFYRLMSFLTGLRKVNTGYGFFYTYETMPPVPVKRVLANIKRDYDAVLVFFWQGLLSFATIQGIYNRLHCQIHFMGVDYSQMSGGCHFTHDCQKYKTGCGCCPAINSRNVNDFTRFNVKYRKKVYEAVKPIVLGNLYMRSCYYNTSYLLKDARVEPSFDIFNENEFYPMDKDALRTKYGISHDKKFILFFGCQRLNDPRKGMDYLIKSLRIFWDSLNPLQRKGVLALIAGREIDEIKDSIEFDVNYVGYVPSSQMPELYSLADVFLSPSVDDAGPTMVNQSLCCGTPVIAFEMGAALETVRRGMTGYCAKLKDCEDFAKGIYQLYSLSKEEYASMKNQCRDAVLSKSSYEVHVKDFLRIYKKYLQAE